MRRDQSTVQKGQGKISIHRRTDTTVRDGDVISVCIEDAISGIVLIEGQMSLKAFANAVYKFIPVDEWEVLDAKRQEEREAERAAAVAAKKKVRKRG